MDYINEILANELENLLEEDDNIVVIDVREEDEIASGMIANAVHIPLHKIPHSMDRLNKHNHYVFVCRSGGRSLIAAEFLEERGYTVSNMSDGMLKWQGEIVI